MSKKNLPARKRVFPVFLLFSAYRKTAEIEEIIRLLEEKNSEFAGIFCPLCSWQPNAASRWICADSDAPEYFYGACWTAWNTFETRGKCPGCLYQWRWTSCLRCGGWSRHEDWYRERKNQGT